MKIPDLNRASFRLQLASRLLSAAVLVVFVFLLAVPPVAAVTKSGDVMVTATVDKPAPTVASTIDSPIDGEVFQTAPIVVSGTCPEEDLLIIILSNGSFVGSTTCDSSGHYLLKITPFVGTNALVARELNSSNKYGPDSNTVHIIYTPLVTPAAPTSPTTPGRTPAAAVVPQLRIDLDPHYVGSTYAAGQLLNIPLKITGGTQPYALYVLWGDGSSSLLSQATTDSFVIAHKYVAGGIYHATLQASDTLNQKTTLEVAIIISGEPAASKKVTTVQKITNKLWPPTYVYVGVAVLLLIIGYLVGRRVRRKHTKVEAPPTEQSENHSEY